ncbi:xanthine/uracil permease [Dacryopinax primogenitus]|uniref:Xanthine/uracil permease n=1 Tax=Dacryopinax primogenitus (strain DJM 731) TaxID=1858805 RepID=M5FZX3_DACPD|nr:xanthine/uracil permease [Dacryopinax primogenitus]EJT97062.1 xanthine/uracil permease [Dacryopinax primogenitus]
MANATSPPEEPEIKTQQPVPVDASTIKISAIPVRGEQLRDKLVNLRQKLTTRHGWLGDYDFVWLCSPTLPFTQAARRKNPPFFPLHADLPLVLAIICGFQHALAMLAGLITPPIIFSSALNLSGELQAYMISASLIACGILSLVQMSRIRLPGGYFIGTGLITVVGTSFATLSTAFAIFDSMYANGTCPVIQNADGTTTNGPCPDAYGYLLGTSLICSFLEMGMSFVPVRILQRIFPPVVTGTVIVMIGASLIGTSGAPNWAGGSNDCASRPTSGIFQLCPTIFAPKPLPWGSPQFMGLGFLSFVSIVLTELFGSPFLKNASIIVGLLVGCIVAGACGYIDGSSIQTAPAITFLWVHTFNIRVYAPAILPMLAVYISLAMEAIGDIAASAEASRVDVEGPEFDSRIQGGVLSDGLGGFFSALFTVTPLSVFAQNNGVIVITRCANRGAGRWCCFFIILFGILGKLSGVFLAIPNSVLGGVTTFLFASVVVSGIRVLSYLPWTRRDRFIVAAAFTFGIADLLVPSFWTYLFLSITNASPGLQGLLDSISIILTTPFLIAGIVALVLNLILPIEIRDPCEVDGKVPPARCIADIEAHATDNEATEEKEVVV